MFRNTNFGIYMRKVVFVFGFEIIATFAAKITSL